METWLRLVIAAIDDVVDAPEWLAEVRQDWYAVATGVFGFGVIPELDEFLTGEDRRRVILDLCRAARRRLAELADPIPKAVLNQINTGIRDGWYTSEVPAAIFADTGDRFLELIRDTPLD